MGCVSVRDRTIYEEIRALKEFKVPEYVIECIIAKLAEQEEREKQRYKDKDAIISTLRELNEDKSAVIDAVGDYILTKLRYRGV